MEYLAEPAESEHRQPGYAVISESVLDAVELAMHRTQSMVVSLCSSLGEADAHSYMKPIRKQWTAWNKLREQADRVKRRVTNATNLFDKPRTGIWVHPLSDVRKTGRKRPLCVVCNKQTREYCPQCEGSPALCSGFCATYYHNPGYPRPHDFQEWNTLNRNIDELVSEDNPPNEPKKNQSMMQVSVAVPKNNTKSKNERQG